MLLTLYLSIDKICEWMDVFLSSPVITLLPVYPHLHPVLTVLTRPTLSRPIGIRPPPWTRLSHPTLKTGEDAVKTGLL